MKLIFAILILSIHCLTLNAQNDLRLREIKANNFYSRQEGEVQRGTYYSIASRQEFTAIILRIEKGNFFLGSYILAENDTFYLKQKTEGLKEDSIFIVSRMVSFPHNVNEVTFYSGNINGKIQISFIDGSLHQGGTPEEGLRKKKENVGLTDTIPCSLPLLVDQMEWKENLTIKSYSREFTEVKNIIIHHSASLPSGNNLVDIRNIYIEHVYDNGWDDVGYNYVIFPDGNIYKGRDPIDSTQDEVKGAHFCKNNNQTMGICLVGDYSAQNPSAQMIHSLIKLTSWKIRKENVDPKSIQPHPLDSMLQAIAGHRDGCATECPGNNLYALLDSIRNLVQVEISKCTTNICYDCLVPDFSFSQNFISLGDTINYINTSAGDYFSAKWYFEKGNPSFSQDTLPIDVIYTTNGIFNTKLVVRNQFEEKSKTLIIKVGDIINEVIQNDFIRIYPVPASDILTIEFSEELPLAVNLVDAFGKIVALSLEKIV